jgi:hypothetical protein
LATVVDAMRKSDHASSLGASDGIDAVAEGETAGEEKKMQYYAKKGKKCGTWLCLRISGSWRTDALALDGPPWHWRRLGHQPPSRCQ